MLESMVSGSNFAILNLDSPTRLPDKANPSSPDVSLVSTTFGRESLQPQMMAAWASHHIPSDQHRSSNRDIILGDVGPVDNGNFE